MAQEGFIEKFKAANPEERWLMLLDLVRASLREILVMSEDEELDNERPFADLGLDSFTAVRLRTTLQETLGDAIALQSTDIFDNASVKQLCTFIAAGLSIEVKVPNE